MPVEIRVTGLEELHQRFSDFPNKFRQAVNKTMEAALYAVWENVQPYPPPPSTSTYRRTGTLGRTLGVSQGGAMGGKPDIFGVKEEGDITIGEFGTNLEYAPYVIGENQAWMHQGRWWTIADVAEKSKEKVEALFEVCAERLAAWLERNEEI